MSEFLNAKQILSPPDEIFKEKTSFEFNFKKPYLKHESYKGKYASVKYFVKIIIESSILSSTYEKEFAVVNPHKESILYKNDFPLRLNVGVKNVLSLSIEFDHSNYNCRGTLKGAISFNLVNTKIKFIEVQLIRREIIFDGKKYEPEYIATFELIDGSPINKEKLPVRLFLKSYNITPSYPNIEEIFGVKYFLNFVVVDADENRYFKYAEINLFRLFINKQKLLSDYDNNGLFISYPFFEDEYKYDIETIKKNFKNNNQNRYRNNNNNYYEKENDDYMENNNYSYNYNNNADNNMVLNIPGENDSNNNIKNKNNYRNYNNSRGNNRLNYNERDNYNYIEENEDNFNNEKIQYNDYKDNINENNYYDDYNEQNFNDRDKYDFNNNQYNNYNENNENDSDYNYKGNKQNINRNNDYLYNNISEDNNQFNNSDDFDYNNRNNTQNKNRDRNIKSQRQREYLSKNIINQSNTTKQNINNYNKNIINIQSSKINNKINKRNIFGNDDDFNEPQKQNDNKSKINYNKNKTNIFGNEEDFIESNKINNYTKNTYNNQNKKDIFGEDDNYNEEKLDNDDEQNIYGDSNHNNNRINNDYYQNNNDNEIIFNNNNNYGKKRYINNNISNNNYNNNINIQRQNYKNNIFGYNPNQEENLTLNRKNKVNNIFGDEPEKNEKKQNRNDNSKRNKNLMGKRITNENDFNNIFGAS